MEMMMAASVASLKKTKKMGAENPTDIVIVQIGVIRE
jgi:hypothetical protein